MALLETSYIKNNFPEWEKFCNVENSDLSPGEFLANMLSIAEQEFGQYIIATEQSITENQKRMLLIIVKKKCFDLKHGDTSFKYKPQIIIDYEKTIELLDNFRKRQHGIGATGDIKMTAKDKHFDEWFTDAIEEADDPI